MKDDKKDWEHVNSLIKQREKGNLPALDGKFVPLVTDTPEGIIERFRAKQIERKAGLKMLRTYYDEKVKVVEEQIRQAAHLKKKEALVEAYRFLKELDRRQVEYFGEFGLKNKELRERTAIKLFDQTAETLSEIADKDYPPAMKDDLIKGVWKLHNEFFQKLLVELEELGETPE